jgi:hypothetical protein
VRTLRPTAHAYRRLNANSHIITFPIKDASILNVVAFITDRSKWPERSSE